MPVLDSSLLRATVKYDPEGAPPVQELNAKVTFAGRMRWCQVDADVGGVVHPALSYFKIGEGGWIEDNSVRVPRDPDPSLTDLDCVLDSARPIHLQRYPALERYSFQKSFTGGDLSLESTMTVLAECILALGDGNTGTGMFWEIGVFDAAGFMIVYATFTEGEAKTVAKTMQRDVRIYRE